MSQTVWPGPVYRLRQATSEISSHGVDSMNTRKLLVSAVLAYGGLMAASSNAAMIPTFQWTTDGGFVIGGSTCSNGGEAACDITYANDGVTPSTIDGTASIMTWGTPSTITGVNGEKSGLQGVFGTSGEGPHNAELLSSGEVTIPQFEPLFTNLGWTNTGAAVHYNNVITSQGGYMDSSVLSTSFQLTAPLLGDVETTNIDISFRETSNLDPDCPFGNPHGTICDDLFTLSSLPPPFVFNFDGFQYTVAFQFANGPGSIVVDNQIWTAEEAPGTAVMFTQARIDAVPIPVPAPGVLALMGMGLMMLGWKTRGQKVA